MLNFFDESDEMTMAVQVGPDSEIVASSEDEKIDNPISAAKSDPETISVAKCNESYYVDCKDVVKYAKLAESNLMDSLNKIIACNEGVNAQNLFVVVDESTMKYVPGLERYGVQCTQYVVRESDGVDDVEMDVQVGPNEDEVKVSEDPQVVNPVDAVKREYNNVVVAKTPDDKFFTDVEDVQKCAELKCESVVETLNGIIAANEGMSAQNLSVLIHPNTSKEVKDLMESAGVNMVIDTDEI